MPEITIAGKDGSFSAYLATPAAGSGPGIAGNSLVTIHPYPGLDHAFCRVGGQNYDRAGADLSNRRTADFLKAHLA